MLAKCFGEFMAPLVLNSCWLLGIAQVRQSNCKFFFFSFFFVGSGQGKFFLKMPGGGLCTPGGLFSRRFGTLPRPGNVHPEKEGKETGS